MQSPLTDCKDFISKKDLNDAKKSCENTLKSLDKDIKKVSQDIQSTIQNDGSGRPSIFKRTLRINRISKRCWSCHRNRNSNCH